MGVADSNLTSVGYDLVCAVPREIIEAELYDYVIGLTEFSCCFDIYGNPISAEAIGTDPFTLGDNDSSVQTLGGVNFWWGFKATPGRLAGATTLPVQVQLDQGTSSIGFKLYFAEFKVIWLENSYAKMVLLYSPVRYIFYSGGRLRSFVQDPANPTTFSFSVNLAVGDVDPNAVPAAIQAALDPNTMFSVKRLFLDFANSQLVGVSPAGDAWDYLFNPDTYQIPVVYELVHHLNAVDLGYVATAGSATSSAAPAAGFVPTALGFQVSPYLNPDGTAGDTNLNTLNYLMMSNNDVMPPAMPAISWNWIDPTQDEEKTKAGMELKFHGVLATRRNVFAQALGQVLNPATAALKVAPKISGTGQNWLMTINTSPTPCQWQLSTDGSTLLTISGNWGDYGYTPGPIYTMQGGISIGFAGSVRIVGPNTIVVDLYFTVVNNISLIPNDPDQGTTPFLDASYYSQQTYYDLDVSQDTNKLGQLVATRRPSQPNDTVSVIAPTDMLPAFISSTVVSMIDDLMGAAQGAVSGVDDAITGLINAPGGCVFPGANTLHFNTVVFSANQDLVVHFLY